MNASSHRDTPFELVAYQQGANSFGVLVAERAKPGEPAVQLDLEETMFSADDMAAIHAAQAILEQASARKVKELSSKPEDSKALINAAAQAKKDLEATQAAIAASQQAADLAAIAAKADLDAELEAKRREAAQLDADLATLRAATEIAKTE